MNTGVKDLQRKIKNACKKLQKLGYDSLMVITSKDTELEVHDGSVKGRQFMDDFPDYFKEYIHYCKVKKEEQAVDQFETNIKTAEVKPEMEQDNQLSDEKDKNEEITTEESEGSENNVTESAEIQLDTCDAENQTEDLDSGEGDFDGDTGDFDVENGDIDAADGDGDFDADLGDGDESGLEEEMDNNEGVDNTVDANKKKRRINKSGKGKKVQGEKPKRRKRTPKDPSAPKETFDCEQCNKKYTSKKALIVHNRKHTGDAPYKCKLCDKAFRCSSFLRSHETVHSEELKYQCDQCERAFAWKDSLRRHRISIHTNERRYNCDKCEATFKDQSALRKHIYRHSGVKNHACQECGKTFMFQYQVTEHMFTHSDEKRFECKICQQRYSSRLGVRKHELKQHPNEDGPRPVAMYQVLGGPTEVHIIAILSLWVRKPTIWVTTRSDTNRHVQLQKMA